MVSKYCIMPAYNAIRKNIYNLYGSESQGNPDKTSEQNWDGTESSRLLQKAGTNLSRCCPYAGKNTKLMNTGIHGYSKGVMNNQNQRHRYNQKHSQIKGYQ